MPGSRRSRKSLTRNTREDEPKKWCVPKQVLFTWEPCDENTDLKSFRTCLIMTNEITDSSWQQKCPQLPSLWNCLFVCVRRLEDAFRLSQQEWNPASERV